MTNPQDSGRETRVVPVKGRSIVVRQLTDAQMFHVMRHARILQKADVAIPDKLDSVERMLSILSKMVVQQSDRDYLRQLEEDGEIELKDLMDFIKIFQDEEPAPEKPKVRRGRPPVKRA
jgi:hypothetical protein